MPPQHFLQEETLLPPKTLIFSKLFYYYFISKWQIFSTLNSSLINALWCILKTVQYPRCSFVPFFPPKTSLFCILLSKEVQRGSSSFLATCVKLWQRLLFWLLHIDFFFVFCALQGSWRGSSSFFGHLCIAMAMAAIWTVTYRWWVIVLPDYFSAKSVNFCCCALITW